MLHSQTTSCSLTSTSPKTIKNTSVCWGSLTRILLGIDYFFLFIVFWRQLIHITIKFSSFNHNQNKKPLQITVFTFVQQSWPAHHTQRYWLSYQFLCVILWQIIFATSHPNLTSIQSFLDKLQPELWLRIVFFGVKIQGVLPWLCFWLIELASKASNWITQLRTSLTQAMDKMKTSIHVTPDLLKVPQNTPQKAPCFWPFEHRNSTKITNMPH